jgi:predicted transposase/invertase (TIGR01784 family)
MAQEVVSAKLDVVFKTLFVRHKNLLKAFISDILDIPKGDIENLVITNPEMPPEALDGKFSRLDLNIKVKGKLINIEIQINNEADYKDRALFYWAKLFTSELKSGQVYGDLQQAYTINIINFNMFEENNFHSEIVPVIKGTDKIFSDKMKIHFFELPKVAKKIDKNNRKQLWMQFIKADSKEDFDMLADTKVQEIVDATNVILDMSNDTRIKELARMREKMLFDEASMINSAKREGLAEGIDKIISAMRKQGISEEQIELMRKMAENE